MLSDDKHCELLTDHIRDRNTFIMDSFKLFVQMFTALVGGSAAIRLQYYQSAPKSFAWLADGLGLLIFVITTFVILENLRAWHDLRERLSEVAGLDDRGNHIIRPPHAWWGNRVEILMLVVMAASVVAFWTFNPLRSN